KDQRTHSPATSRLSQLCGVSAMSGSRATADGGKAIAPATSRMSVMAKVALPSAERIGKWWLIAAHTASNARTSQSVVDPELVAKAWTIAARPLSATTVTHTRAPGV